MQSNLTYMLTSGGHENSTRNFFFYNTTYEQDCLNCINRAYLIHVARLTNGFARLRDDRARLCEVCE